MAAKISTQNPETLMRQMAALSDPTRLRLLRLLERQELGVAELCEILQMPQSTVSRHLKILSADSWVVSRRAGTTNLYRMILDEIPQAARDLWLLTRDQTANWPTLNQDKIRLEECLKRRQSNVRSFFEGAAGDWGAIRESLYGSAFSHLAIQSLIPANYTVADLGCGSADLAIRLAPTVNKVIAVDNSSAMIKAARAGAKKYTNLDILEGELDNLPIADNHCDAAMLVLVLSYIPEIEPVLQEAARILKPNGKLVIVDLLHHNRDDFRRQLGQHHMGFDPAALTAAFKATNLTNPICNPLPPQPDTTGPALLLATAQKPG
ncbi:ArsR/SmtB family transcription factor [Poriferisphaera sp. WC338]|uniref:ArsR/SmtB family transcription factor n=1 Tax=Poriferisphaera sp. WC338 TaxID=3425129 RepID=UPI003D81A568